MAKVSVIKDSGAVMLWSARLALLAVFPGFIFGFLEINSSISSNLRVLDSSSPTCPFSSLFSLSIGLALVNFNHSEKEWDSLPSNSKGLPIPSSSSLDLSSFGSGSAISSGSACTAGSNKAGSITLSDSDCFIFIASLISILRLPCTSSGS